MKDRFMNNSNENSRVIKNFINAYDARKTADLALHEVFPDSQLATAEQAIDECIEHVLIDIKTLCKYGEFYCTVVFYEYSLCNLREDLQQYAIARIVSYLRFAGYKVSYMTACNDKHAVVVDWI